MGSFRSASADAWSSFGRNTVEIQLVCDLVASRHRWSKKARTTANIVKPISPTATDANVKPPVSSISSEPEVSLDSVGNDVTAPALPTAKLVGTVHKV